MRHIADLHIHSPFSRGSSPAMDLPGLGCWARLKGISILGTGDFTHPGWREILGEGLKESGAGLFILRDGIEKIAAGKIPSKCLSPLKLVLTSEVSTIFRREGRVFKSHVVLVAPSLTDADRISHAMGRHGNLASDGRPTLSIDLRDLLEIVLGISPETLFIPAHAWTPHFSIFGSRSGFDSLEEAFGDLSKHIHAIETGLSSDPPMNRMVSGLDRIALVSNSDAHSPSRLGREANIFHLPEEPSFADIAGAIRTNDPERFPATIEFFPEQGKYHLDGHRNCLFSCLPRETRKLGKKCPVCGKKITVGVLHRVEDLADRSSPPETKARPFHRLVPMADILGAVTGVGAGSRRVAAAYKNLLSSLGPELPILIDIPEEEIERIGPPGIGAAIGRLRRSEIGITPGYDGRYGEIILGSSR